MVKITKPKNKAYDYQPFEKRKPVEKQPDFLLHEKFGVGGTGQISQGKLRSDEQKAKDTARIVKAGEAERKGKFNSFVGSKREI